jgi:predicted ArsR family transcriptional regulator
MSEPVAGLDAVAVLGDPLRRRAYQVVVDARDAIGRDEVAAQLGVGRTLAAFHLDKLAAVGLLEISYARLGGRTGPGAGRPAKLYRQAATEVAVSLPPRSYPQAARLLAEAVEAAGADAALFATARRSGAEIGVGLVDGPVSGLRAQGYQPVEDGSTIRLANCPFHALAAEFPPLVCGMNLALIEGMAHGAGWHDRVAAIDPAPDGCCVTLTRQAVRSKNKTR